MLPGAVPGHLVLENRLFPLTRGLRDCGAPLESLPYLFSGDPWRMLECFFLPERSQGQAQLGEKGWAAPPASQWFAGRMLRGHRLLMQSTDDSAEMAGVGALAAEPWGSIFLLGQLGPQLGSVWFCSSLHRQ